MPEIRRTADARLDYLQIFLYVAERNLTAAERLVRRFDENLELISTMPLMGAARPELGRDLRSFPVGDYLLIYRPVKEGIELVRVVHGARNLRRIFKHR